MILIDIRQRLVDLGLVVSGLDYPWINYYRISGYNSRYVVWLKKDCIEVVKDLHIMKWYYDGTITNTNIISTSVAIKYYDFFEAEKQIKKIIERYKELQLEFKKEKIRERLKYLEKDFENE